MALLIVIISILPSMQVRCIPFLLPRPFDRTNSPLKVYLVSCDELWIWYAWIISSLFPYMYAQQMRRKTELLTINACTVYSGTNLESPLLTFLLPLCVCIDISWTTGLWDFKFGRDVAKSILNRMVYMMYIETENSCLICIILLRWFFRSSAKCV